MGTVTADLLVQGETPAELQGGDGFRDSNLVFTETPLSISMGGNDGNSAYVLAGLGTLTTLCGAVGKDLLGDALVNWLEGRGVDLTGLARSDAHATSTSTIIMRDAENQRVYHHLGATAQADFETMPQSLFATADALLVSSFPIMPRLRSGGFARALARVHEAGGITALDIGPAIGDSLALDELIPLLPTVDYFIANTHELISLTGAGAWQNAVGEILAAGARHVVIKQGAGGSAIWTSDERMHVPGFPVDANVSVGAGDSFNAGFLYALLQGRSLAEALQFGNAVAALVVSDPEGILNSPTQAQVETFLLPTELSERRDKITNG